MGIRKVSLDYLETSLEDEEWKGSSRSELSLDELAKVADEIHGFGLEVEWTDEVAEGDPGDSYCWRIVAIKTDPFNDEPDDPYAGMIDETGKVEMVVGVFKR